MEQPKYTLQGGETTKALTEYDDKVLPAPTDLALHPFPPGDGVNLNTWKTSNTEAQLTPKRTGPHSVILTTHPALKLQGSLHGGITLE